METVRQVPNSDRAGANEEFGIWRTSQDKHAGPGAGMRIFSSNKKAPLHIPYKKEIAGVLFERVH